MNITGFEGKIIKTERKNEFILVKLTNQDTLINLRIFSDFESLQNLKKLLNENIYVNIIGNLITQKSGEFYLDEPIGVYEKASISGRVEDFEVDSEDVRLILNNGEVIIPLETMKEEPKIDIGNLIGSIAHSNGYVPLCLIENGFYTYKSGKKPVINVKNRLDFHLIPRRPLMINTLISSILGGIVGIATYLTIQSVGIMHTSYFTLAWLLPFIFGGISSSYILKGEKIDSITTGIGTGILLLTAMIVLDKNGIYPFYSILKSMFPISFMVIIIGFLIMIQSPIFSFLIWKILER